ncbi:histone-fold-containing protein [Aspergillus sclerotioniger CBS 115572]|uniref:Histone-fold-containing protein n=1 Tax=Aspergillus sclerotioniger CBS 115572 TaxID=1450535 RepID=A0A317WMZ3_9EURO|nr:histone-fold-containing protein [Aspergillus sclerotioniger CBS 115572]PWY86408.1 histone-fold-containing protein [Aspergillus sclerotioniger CBS 115572]
MSSPPPPSSNPLKRPSISSAASQPLGSHPKRPRMHPLRQTSFPSTIDADTRTYSDAGSVTGSFTGSLGGTSADGVFLTKGKKRGRKSKAEKEREREEGSLRAGMDRMGSVDMEGASVRAGPAGGGGGGGEDADEDEDFDDEGELLGREEGTTDTEAEKKNLALLVDAFNPIQSERYDLFKRAKLRKETLRRIVNHALSQSVPASVVTTINGFTKVFAGEMIEKARTVQAEWAIAHDQAALAAIEAEKTTTSTPAGGVKQEPLENAPMSGVKKEVKLPPNPHRGQLLPAHLREALRRYKRDGEGGGVGFSGLSMGNLGVRGSVTWAAGSVGGRRIFR